MRGATPMRPTSAASGLPIPPTAALEPHGRTVMFRMRMISRVSALVLGLGAMTAALAAEKPVALIIAQGGLGDQSYNDLAYAGFKRAIAAAKVEGKAGESKGVVARPPTYFAEHTT